MIVVPDLRTHLSTTGSVRVFVALWGGLAVVDLARVGHADTGIQVALLTVLAGVAFIGQRVPTALAVAGTVWLVVLGFVVNAGGQLTLTGWGDAVRLGIVTTAALAGSAAGPVVGRTAAVAAIAGEPVTAAAQKPADGHSWWRAAARAVRDCLVDDGTLMVVEPMAGDHVEDNLHVIGRVFYGASTLVCTPGSLDQPGARALGAQAGPAVLTSVLHDAGFGRVRVATSTPVNLVFEARP